MGDLSQDFSRMKSSSSSSSRLETVIWAVKLVFLSVGIVSTFMLFKVSIIPYIFGLILSMVSLLPSVWFAIKSLLSPPYIYILFNFIIITIAAASSYHGNHRHLQQSSETGKKQAERELGGKVRPDIQKTHQNSPKNSLSADIWVQIVDEVGFKREKEEKISFNVEKEPDPSRETRSKETSLKDFDEKSLRQRDIVAKNPLTTTAATEENQNQKEDEVEGEEKSPDTLEDTWRLIMEEKGRALKELKKSETWDYSPQQTVPETAADGGDRDEDPVSWAKREMRKSDTFSDRALFMRREKSMSLDEFNRRVEAFIRKIKNGIRLHKQESDQRQREMANRGCF